MITGGLLLLVGVGVYGRCLWEFVQKGQGIPAPIDHPKELVGRTADGDGSGLSVPK